jgi:hypothetical protein
MTIRERMAACQLFTDDDAHYRRKPRNWKRRAIGKGAMLGN